MNVSAGTRIEMEFYDMGGGSIRTNRVEAFNNQEYDVINGQVVTQHPKRNRNKYKDIFMRWDVLICMIIAIFISVAVTTGLMYYYINQSYHTLLSEGNATTMSHEWSTSSSTITFASDIPTTQESITTTVITSTITEITNIITTINTTKTNLGTTESTIITDSSTSVITTSHTSTKRSTTSTNNMFTDNTVGTTKDKPDVCKYSILSKEHNLSNNNNKFTCDSTTRNVSELVRNTISGRIFSQDVVLPGNASWYELANNKYNVSEEKIVIRINSFLYPVNGGFDKSNIPIIIFGKYSYNKIVTFKMTRNTRVDCLPQGHGKLRGNRIFAEVWLSIEDFHTFLDNGFKMINSKTGEMYSSDNISMVWDMKCIM